MVVRLTAANGLLSRARLVEVAPGKHLRSDAGSSYLRMRRDGCPAGVTSAYRDQTEQYALWVKAQRGDGPTAAAPGQSFHGEGTALDLPEPARAWVRARGGAYGWVRDRVRGETWHMEYEPTQDQHPPAPRPPVPLPLPVPDSEDDPVIPLIETLYRALLDREPSAVEVLSWWEAAQTRRWDAAALHAEFRRSPAEVGTVVSAFRHYLGRTPDDAALAAWHPQGRTIGVLWDGIKGSPEAKARRGER